MISLRSCVTLATFVAASAVFTSCDSATTSPSRPSSAQATSARRDGKIGHTGKAATSGSIDARVALDKSGKAYLEVNTGTLEGATNTQHPNGYFESIQYTVSDASGKQLSVKNVSFSRTQPARYFALINPCSTWSNGDGDNDREDQSPCSTRFSADWAVSVQANVKGLAGDDRATDVVRADAPIINLPDVDLSAQPIWVGQGATRTPLGSVTPGIPTTYSVDFPNLTVAGKPSLVGSQTACVVVVDGRTQGIPFFGNAYSFSYVGAPVQSIPAGTVGSCTFSLTLPTGAHSIVVTAVPLYPGDYDVSNNSTVSRTVQAQLAGPPDVAAVAGGLTADVGPNEVPAATISLGAGETSITTSFHQTVKLVSGAPPGSTTCSVMVDGQLTAGIVTPPVVQPALAAAGGTGVCSFSLTLASGPHTIGVTANATGDNTHDNDLATTNVTVKGSGAFLTNGAQVDLRQEWSNGGPSATPVVNLALQRVQVDQLALLVLPSQASLGTFSIDTAMVTQPGPNGTTTSFGSGTASGTLTRSDAGAQCVGNGALNQVPLMPQIEPELTYYADICTQPVLDAGGAPNGYQQITVGFEQSLQRTIASPASVYVFQPGSTVTVRIVMSYTLNGSTFKDRVSATVKVKVPAFAGDGVADVVTGLYAWHLGPLNQTDPTQVTITAP